MTKQRYSTTQKEHRVSHWQGSLHTAAMVLAQIEARYGEDEAAKYDPETNCFTFDTWVAKGYHIRKGEKGLLSSTIRHKYDDEGNEIASWPSKCWLFYYLQVEKDEPKQEEVQA
jgi:hypothetical protein